MNSEPAKAPAELARDAVANALERFGLAHVRVWLFDERTPEKPMVAAIATRPGSAKYGGLRAESVRTLSAQAPVLASSAPTADVDGSVPGGAFAGLPLGSGEDAVGYVEAYSDGAIAFSQAAAIETWAADLTRAIVSAAATAGMESSRRGHVLVAEDDASIRKLLVVVLSRSGFKVTAVENGQLACDAAKATQPDLVLLDWVMPVLDGRSAAAQLKSDAATRHIPIVMLTSQSRTEDKVSALEAGAQDYLTKPFDSRELVARIEQHLRWRKLLADETAAPSQRVAPASAAQGSNDDGEAPAPANGDYWTAAVQAQQVGRLRHALAYYIQEAENCDGSRQYARAAIAFRSASACAGQLQNLDLSNKLLRLAGKMYLSWAENTQDGKAMQEAYVNAARCFLSAGNLRLARKSVEIAESMHSVIGDDRPSQL